MRALIAAFLVVAVVAALPVAAETVRFHSAVTPPTPLQQRLFKERGQPISVAITVELTGEFYRPTGDGPFPAVVQLHGCGGRGPRESEDAAGARIVALGYALLIVDSFGPRGIKDRCGSNYWTDPVDRMADAYGALAWLTGQPFIDPERIALLGYSQGAIVALSAVSSGGEEALYDRHFRAAIAYYPHCQDFNGTVSVPTLILIGALDDWTPAEICQQKMAQRSGEGALLRLVVYPGAHYGFNMASLRDKPVSYLGHHIEYNEAADRAALAETVAALRQAFGR
ncbi:MAG: dienelactone hydrolase family protein [Reyranella sp.]|nr:dienelactone hydrolase family protein [Reyranella sp.]